MTPLPCPFCNDDRCTVENSVREGDFADPFNYFVLCPSCACEGPWRTSKSGALRRWNTRADPVRAALAEVWDLLVECAAEEWRTPTQRAALRVLADAAKEAGRG